MKKIMKIAIIILSAFIIALAAGGLYYYYPMLKMPSITAGPVQDTNIITINAMSAVYLIKTDSGYIMIDAGLSSKRLQESMNEYEIKPDDVKWIFVTHSDGDHVGGLPLFPNAEIYMNENELPLVDGTVKRNTLGGNSIPSEVDIEKVNLVTDGQILEFDNINIECVQAHGHTIGSMAYLVDEKYFFTGDTIKIENGNMNAHPYSMDENQSLQTIEQLSEIIENSQMILTSHYGIHFRDFN